MPSWRKLMFPWLRDREIEVENQFTPIDIGLNGKGTAVAVGFFAAGRSSERNLDVFILNEEKTLVTIYSWEANGDRYVPTKAQAEADEGTEIFGVLVSDFNHDGFLDLIISLKDPKDDGLHHRLFLGDGQTLKASDWNIPSSLDELTMIDYEGRMLVDLLGVPTSSTSGRLEVWRAQAADVDGLVTGYALESRNLENDKFCQPITPHSHAFADFNGDGFADLLLSCVDGKKHFLELWTSDAERKESGEEGTRTVFKFAQRIELPEGHGPISLGDFNADGSMDIAFAVCNPPATCSQENSVRILFNRQRPFCRRSEEKKCRGLNEIMEAGETFGFDPFEEESRTVFSLDPKQFKVIAGLHPLTQRPVTISIGDFDVDGYPDALLIVEDVRNGKDAENPCRVLLLENVKALGREAEDKNLRTFSRSPRGTEKLETFIGVTEANFMNFYQDGPPDILLNHQQLKAEDREEAGSPLRRGPRVQVVQNGFVRDAFSLRTETLGSVCPAQCMAKSTGSAASHPYGTSFPGPTVKFSFTDFDGSLRIRVGSQLPQNGHGRLMTPFQFFGLGRVNNFVELLAVRTPTRRSLNLAKKAGLVPNSDLIINPPHPDAANKFHFELHIIPGQYFLWVLLSIGTAMLVLAALTAYFKWREMKEDNEERRKALHSINFDAL